MATTIRIERRVLRNARPPLSWLRDQRVRWAARTDVRLGLPEDPSQQVSRFLGIKPGLDPNSPTHQRLRSEEAGHDIPRLKTAVAHLRDLLADHPSIWLLVPALLGLLAAETYGASLLLHDQGYEGWTLYFLSVAFATALFALLGTVVTLAKQRSKLAWLAIPALALCVGAIAAGRRQGDDATWADAVIVILATTGPAALVEVVFSKLKETLPLWRRYRNAIKAERDAVTAQRRASQEFQIIENSGRWWENQKTTVAANYTTAYRRTVGRQASKAGRS
jgi:hypothetical protein